MLTARSPGKPVVREFGEPSAKLTMLTFGVLSMTRWSSRSHSPRAPVTLDGGGTSFRATQRPPTRIVTKMRSSERSRCNSDSKRTAA